MNSALLKHMKSGLTKTNRSIPMENVKTSGFRMLFVVLLMLIGVRQASADIPSVESYLDFLYQYLPMPDKTDYSRIFYKQNVEMSLKARAEMPWGSKVPEREFRHFVLPVRVNNETLDNARTVFYNELKDRVGHLTMKEAILEVNHWCHEKVTYRPSDARTSSPLASLKTAYGRCGEESTFLVAALRSVGIPARQVYTPRWAHTDDNHAWVEAWADGSWYFLGACEPEPVLNLGWFNESASRGMLMHTKVFGDYRGPEDVMSKTACYTEINVIDHYAPTSNVVVKVTDRGKPVEAAVVEFKVYNYAEFYTVATKATDRRGMASLTAGKGDMVVWVSKNGRYGCRQVSFRKNCMVNIELSDGETMEDMSRDWDIVPPGISSSPTVVSSEMRKENNNRLLREDSIRKAYEQTMPVEEWRGNHAVIRQFLDKAQNKLMAHQLLRVISAKDLRDIPLDVLRDNEETVTDTTDLYCRYVMNPRVETEWLTPYKHFFREKMAFIKNPQQLVEWCKDNVRVVEGRNPQQLRMQPMSVYLNRYTDKLGLDIFFVSVARSLGMPARINEVNGKLQYYEHAKWVDVRSDTKTSNEGILLLDYQAAEYYDNPKYYIHFTLSRIVDGRLQLLTYPEEATWKGDFSQGVSLDEGKYMLTVGTRMASGKVLAHTEVFEIKAGQTTRLSFTMREDKESVQVIGSLNAENLYHDLSTNTDKSILSTTGRGYYIIGIVTPHHEPTNHTLRDIGLCKDVFEKWGRKMILLVDNENNADLSSFKEFHQLPSTVVWGWDMNGTIQKEIKEQMNLNSSSLPLFLICDSFNRVVFIQQGYTIGIGEQLAKVIGKL